MRFLDFQCISIQISVRCVPECMIDNKSTLDQVMAWWHRTGTKPLPNLMLHICVTRSQWIKHCFRLWLTDDQVSTDTVAYTFPMLTLIAYVATRATRLLDTGGRHGLVFPHWYCTTTQVSPKLNELVSKIDYQQWQNLNNCEYNGNFIRMCKIMFTTA